MKLDAYRKKRNPARTNEPFGPEPPATDATKVGAFVVHLHDATREHYDLRIEIGGTLASFAVPKGPSLDPESKHLAINTEDHPLEYLDFEAVIPEGQYGAGPMILWDRGVVRYVEAPAEQGKIEGKIDLHLSGYKLGGRYALVRLKKSAKGNEWLLFKKQDAFSSKERDITKELPRSVLSGLTITELPRSKEIARELEDRAKTLGAKARGDHAFTPTALHMATELPRAKGHVFAVKLDGARVLAERSADHVVLLHAGHDVTSAYPEVARALRALPPDRLVLEGDLVALEQGSPSLPALQRRLEKARAHAMHEALLEAQVVFVVSEVHAVGDRDVRPLAWKDRKALLRALVPAAGVLRAGEWLEAGGESALAFCQEHGLEGVVAKPSGAKHAGAEWSFVRAGGAAARPATLDHDEQAPASRGPLRGKAAVTNRAKIFFPEDGLTKGDLCDYYDALADRLLPYLRDRPVALVRYPDGVHGKHFFQWNVPAAMPSWVKTLQLRNDEDDKGERTIKRNGFLVNDRDSLLYIANLGCIPIHVLAWTTRAIERSERVPTSDSPRRPMEEADFLTMDFDVGLSTLANGVKQAKTLRRILTDIGLTGFPKTSGQTGLHVLVPLGRGTSFETAKVLAELFGRLVVKHHPDTATMDRVVSRRGAKVYVDTGQTGHGRTIVCPYSVRATSGAGVSTPLTWDEVDEGLEPSRFNMRTVPRRLENVGDPMGGMLGTSVDVPAAVAKLRSLFAG